MICTPDPHTQVNPPTSSPVDMEKSPREVWHSSQPLADRKPLWPTPHLAEGITYPYWVTDINHPALKTGLVRSQIKKEANVDKRYKASKDSPISMKRLSFPVAYAINLLPYAPLPGYIIPPARPLQLIRSDSEKPDLIFVLECQLFRLRRNPGGVACDPKNPNKPTIVVSWTGEPSGVYPQLDATGATKEISLDICWDCLIDGRECKKLGMILDGPNAGKQIPIEERRVRTINEMLGIAPKYQLVTAAMRKQRADNPPAPIPRSAKRSSSAADALPKKKLRISQAGPGQSKDITQVAQGSSREASTSSSLSSATPAESPLTPSPISPLAKTSSTVSKMSNVMQFVEGLRRQSAPGSASSASPMSAGQTLNGASSIPAAGPSTGSLAGFAPNPAPRAADVTAQIVAMGMSSAQPGRSPAGDKESPSSISVVDKDVAQGLGDVTGAEMQTTLEDEPVADEEVAVSTAISNSPATASLGSRTTTSSTPDHIEQLHSPAPTSSDPTVDLDYAEELKDFKQSYAKRQARNAVKLNASTVSAQASQAEIERLGKENESLVKAKTASDARLEKNQAEMAQLRESHEREILGIKKERDDEKVLHAGKWRTKQAEILTAKEEARHEKRKREQAEESLAETQKLLVEAQMMQEGPLV